MSKDKQTFNAQDGGLGLLEESLGFKKQTFTNADFSARSTLASYNVSTGGKNIPSVPLLATHPFFKIKNYKHMTIISQELF